MNHEIHIFLGTACITKKTDTEYPIGEKHAILFYMREDYNSEYDLAKAKKKIRSLGFNKIVFSKVGKLDPGKITNKNKTYYDKALASGTALVLYTDPIA